MEAAFMAGADPELMLVSPKGDLVSAIGRVPGTKKRPHKVNRGAIQADNVNAEINVVPAANLGDFTESLRQVLRSLTDIISPNLLEVRASANFPASCLRNKKAKEFGCDPDFDAWALDINEVPPGAAMGAFRSAGGHLHIGKKPGIEKMLDDDMGKVMVVRMLDIFVGIPSIIMDQDPTAPARRSLYGKAGAHRPKPYGVEYRALGNFWVRHPKLVEIIYALADVAVRVAADVPKLKEVEALISPEQVCAAINQSNRDLAAQLLEEKIRPYLGDGLYQDVVSQEMHQDLGSKTIYEAWF